jgi:monovalent cation/hydrogen antiporter
MYEVELVLVLLAIIAVLVSVAGRLSLPYPIVLVVGGLLLGFVPGLPVIELDPHVVFILFLPPLLYWDAASTSWRDFRSNVRTISSLAIGLVVATTVIVAILAHYGLNLSWAASFTLGAIVSPTDPVSASSVMRRLGVPPKVITIVQGESLVNDATALVVFGTAVEVLKTGTFSPGRAALEFVFVCIGGILVGMAIGWALHGLQREIDEARVSSVLRLMTPFVVYIAADAIHVSGILAVVVTGLYIGRKAPTELSSAERLGGDVVWPLVTFIINGLVFILIGLQFEEILRDIDHRSYSSLIRDVLLVSLAVILVRMIWTYLAGLAVRLLPDRLEGRETELDRREATIVGWSGMRGVVALAIALSLPRVTETEIFVERPQLLFLTFGVILVTLVGQGLSLPWVITRLGVTRGDRAEREEKHARSVISNAALKRLGQLAREMPSTEMYDTLERYYRRRVTEAENPTAPGDDSWVQGIRAIRREMLIVERQALVDLRDQNVISDTVLRQIQRELDIEEMHLNARAF